MRGEDRGEVGVTFFSMEADSGRQGEQGDIGREEVKKVDGRMKAGKMV